MSLLIALILLIGCGTAQDTATPQPVNKIKRIEELKLQYQKKEALAIQVRAPENNWLVQGCDGMLWTGKYASTICDVNIRAAEKEIGRFERRPPPACWDEVNGDQGAKTTWSRDMGDGLFTYAYYCKDAQILEDHANYGESHNWVMGMPLDSRLIYTLNMRSTLYKMLKKFKGVKNAYADFPLLVPQGLTDYEAHLQMLSILVVSDMQGGLNSDMKKRINEHYSREPNNPMYSYMRGLITGDMNEVANLLLANPVKYGSYVRCEDQWLCELSEWLFVAKRVLETQE